MFFNYGCDHGTIIRTIVCKDLLRAFYRLSKITVTIFPTDLGTNLFLSSFCPVLQTKNKNKVFSKLVVW